jgi:hypothetical protein
VLGVPNVALLGVFDGTCGDMAAEFVHRRLIEEIVSSTVRL